VRRLRTVHTRRFQFGLDVPDRADVRAWLPAEAPIEHTGAREICVIAPFMRNGDQLIRTAANHPVDNAQVIADDSARQFVNCPGPAPTLAGVHPADLNAPPRVSTHAHR